jgi:paraquat-inducible protein A
VTASLVACPGCDLLQRLPALRPGDRATCARCAHVLARRPVNGLDRCLPLTVAAAILLVVANVTPLMDLSAVGRTASTTIIGGAIEMWSEGERATAVIVAFCAVIAPAAFITSMLTVLVAARRHRVPLWTGEVLRWMRYLHVWSLQEVMMLGILVALVKIAELARVDAGLGIFSIGALTILFPAIMVNFDSRAIWERLEWARESRPAGPPAGSGGAHA